MSISMFHEWTMLSLLMGRAVLQPLVQGHLTGQDRGFYAFKGLPHKLQQHAHALYACPSSDNTSKQPRRAIYCAVLMGGNCTWLPSGMELNVGDGLPAHFLWQNSVFADLHRPRPLSPDPGSLPRHGEFCALCFGKAGGSESQRKNFGSESSARYPDFDVSLTHPSLGRTHSWWPVQDDVQPNSTHTHT